jgi:seryl-tRNA synthetase
LKLPYRILRLCGGIWGSRHWLWFRIIFYRVKTVGWNQLSFYFETFQANRLKLRFKDKDGKPTSAYLKRFIGFAKSVSWILKITRRPKES